MLNTNNYRSRGLSKSMKRRKKRTKSRPSMLTPLQTEPSTSLKRVTTHLTKKSTYPTGSLTSRWWWLSPPRTPCKWGSTISISRILMTPIDLSLPLTKTNHFKTIQGSLSRRVSCSPRWLCIIDPKRKLRSLSPRDGQDNYNNYGAS